MDISHIYDMEQDHQHDCMGVQRHNQQFIHMELISYDNKQHNICT